MGVQLLLMSDTNTTTDTASLPIGVFDSGVGGLTVLRALRELLPREDYLYLGDTARLPYGTKSPRTVTSYARQCARLLMQRGVKLLVVACNTASAAALPVLRQEFPGMEVVGVVEPGARAGCAVTRNRTIAVVATESTVNGGAYQAAIRELCPQMRIEAAPCALFVSLAEEGWTHGDVAEAVTRRYLEPLFQRFGTQKPDSLVLGCTHFPVLAETIRKVAGPEVTVIDSAETTAREVARLVELGSLANRHGGSVRFLATDGPERFARVGSIFMGHPLSAQDIELVDL